MGLLVFHTRQSIRLAVVKIVSNKKLAKRRRILQKAGQRMYNMYCKHFHTGLLWIKKVMILVQCTCIRLDPVCKADGLFLSICGVTVTLPSRLILVLLALIYVIICTYVVCWIKSFVDLRKKTIDFKALFLYLPNTPIFRHISINSQKSFLKVV